MPQKDWSAALAPLIKQYGKRPHPLQYANTYQLLVMVVLSAQDSDRNINNLAPALFQAFPDMRSLANAQEEDLIPYVSKVRGHRKKIAWLIDIAKTIKEDSGIPLTLDELVKLKGIGRKSANVILRESGAPAEGIMVDLHVVRVAPRLGITQSDDPKRIEQDLMRELPQKQWADAGMSISYLGREICRPSHPEHQDCIMREHCAYYLSKTGKQSSK